MFEKNNILMNLIILFLKPRTQKQNKTKKRKIQKNKKKS
jgi:hypothetical protein